MKDKLYILTRANSDNEYDDVTFCYIEISRADLKTIKRFDRTFTDILGKDVNSICFSNPLSVAFLTSGIDEDEVGKYDECLDGNPIFLKEPLPEELIEQNESDWRISPYDLCMYSAGSFYVKGLYKHDRGGVETGELSIDDLEKQFQEAA